MDTEPIAVALKFGFLAVLYLFLFWVSRSALRELRRTTAPAPEATGFHPVGPGGRAAATDAFLVAVRGGGLPPGERYDLFGGLSIGRSSDADVRIEDRFASAIHARLYSRGASYYVEDMSSTNGTFLNGGQLAGEAELSTSTRSRSATRSSASSSRSPGSTSGSMLKVADHAFRTDTGRQRNANEDSYYVHGRVFAVADGMGGAQAGEVASRIAADSFESAARSGESGESYLRSIAEAANERIHSLAQDDKSHSGMGTTLTAALVEGDEVSFAHVGDSRAYVYRDGELRLLTSDHSLVEELRRQGRLTDEQAEDHPQRSIITRALGPEAEVDIDTLTFSARPGDVFLICSDGLTTMIRDERIAEVLESSRNLDEAAASLVAEANEAGGRDNITVVAFRLEEADDAEVADDATLIGPSAEEAGLDAERVRAAAERRGAGRASRLGPAPTPEDRREGPRRAPRHRRDRRRRRLRSAPGLLPGHRRGRQDRAVPRPALRAAARPQPLQRGLLGAGPGASLPEDRRDSLTDHELRSRDDADSLIEDLESAAVAPLPAPPEGGADAATQPNQGPPKGGGGGSGGGQRSRDRQRQGGGDQEP